MKWYTQWPSQSWQVKKLLVPEVKYMYTLPNSRSNMPINRLSDIAAWVTPRIQKSNNLPRCRCMSTQLLPRTQCCLPGKWAYTIVGHTCKSFPICLDEPLCQQPPSFFLIYIFFKHSVISWTDNIHVVRRSNLPFQNRFFVCVKQSSLW